MHTMKPSHILLSILCAAVLGSNFISSKFALMHFPPFLFTALRFGLLALLLLPFVNMPRRSFKMLTVMGVFVALNFGLVVAGLAQGLDIATCIIASQLAVPAACGLSAWLLKDHFGPWRMVGMIVAFAGVALVAGTPDAMSSPLGFWLTVAGALAGGVLNIVMKKLEAMPTLRMLAWMSFFSAWPLALLSLLFEENQWEIMVTIPPPAALALIYTIIITTLFAYSAWYWLLRHNPVSQVAPFSLLSPLFGIGLGQVFFEESLPSTTLIGGALTLVGVGLIILRRPRLGAHKEI